jgi:hypothetical protein
MKNKRNISVWQMADGDGYGVSGKCTQEEAFEAIKQEMHECEEDAEVLAAFKVEDVKPSRLFRHKRCDVGTVGDGSACYDCGEPHNGVGRQIFVWFR